MLVNRSYTAAHLIATLCVIIIVAARAAEDGEIDIDIVDCPDQQEACKCRKTAEACQFRLDIEELQTFTSYKINEDRDIITRGTPGDTYFITQNGFVASIDPNNGRIPEIGPCWNNSTLSSETDFNDMGCSVPMIVDGRSYRQFVAVNGRIPGPTLIVYKDQAVVIDVFNHLTNEGITIHWHGIHQRGIPWMDGVAAVSQAPIVPGGQFRYIFNAAPSGTHWYHSHLGSQRTDGLFGALIVHESDKEHQDIIADVSEDIPGNQIFMDLPEMHTITLLDWQRESSINLFIKIHSTLGFYPQLCPTTLPENNNMPYNPRTNSTDGIEVGPVPYWSGLINGRGRYNATNLGVLSVFNVGLSVSYRFRIIGAQSLYAYKFEIEDHKLRVLATDGQIVHLTGPLDYIIVHSGERYDFILDTKEEIPSGENGNYWIRAETLEVASTIRDGRSVHLAEAVLHYAAPGVPNPNSFIYDNVITRPRQCTQQAKCIALNCPFKEFPAEYNTDCMVVSQLRNRFSNELPRIDNRNSDNLKFFNFGFEGQSSTSAINGRNFLPPASPYQTYPGEYDRDVKDNRTCQSCNSQTTPRSQPNQCTCTYVEKVLSTLKLNDGNDNSVMMVLSAVGFNTNRDFSHPVHLHGHSFYVVHVGYGTYSDGILVNNSMDIECDTVLCMNPRWRNGIPNAVKVAMSSTGRLIDSAVRKDTVIVPAGGYVVIAFVGDNPGYWFLHCHIEVHQLEGMAVIIQEYSEDQQNYDNLPDDINKPGKFNWSVADFMRLSSAGECMRSLSITLFSIILFMSTMIAAGY